MSMSLSEQLKSYFSDNLPDFLDLLHRMVDINSFTANPEGVDALGRMTAVSFADLGFEFDTVPSDNPLYGQHAVLTRVGIAKNGQTPRKIGLISHLDTVFPAAEERQNDFHWRVEGERIYGPGTMDIKGGTVMIYMILSALQKFEPDVFDATTWVVLLDANEETGGIDFGRLCIERLGGAESNPVCLVFEPGAWTHDNHFKIVAARKGMATYHITTEGRASHAGSAHERGANAVVQMADVVGQVAQLTDYSRDLTFNIGTIAGGTVTNRVPHMASSFAEMRAFTADVFADGVEQMLALNDLSTVASVEGGFACKVNVELIRETSPWSRNSRTDGLMDVWRETAVSLDYHIIPEERGGLSDGNHIWHAIPTIDGLGPAGANAHCSEHSADGSKEQEYVLATAFVPKALLNTLAILRLAKEL